MADVCCLHDGTAAVDSSRTAKKRKAPGLQVHRDHPGRSVGLTVTAAQGLASLLSMMVVVCELLEVHSMTFTFICAAMIMQSVLNRRRIPDFETALLEVPSSDIINHNPAPSLLPSCVTTRHQSLSLGTGPRTPRRSGAPRWTGCCLRGTSA